MSKQQPADVRRPIPATEAELRRHFHEAALAELAQQSLDTAARAQIALVFRSGLGRPTPVSEEGWR